MKNKLITVGLVALSCLPACKPPSPKAVRGVTAYYVDFDWTGTSAGTASQPFKTLSTAEWNAINSSLASANVTLFFPALKPDGVTQQSKTLFVQVRRVDPGANRLTLDGYSFYNTNASAPSWAANPDTDINHAYLNGKVFKIEGGTNPIDSTMAMGWNRDIGQDFVTHNGLAYCCIESHVASPENEPGAGANWPLYWDQHGSADTEWSGGTRYKCYPKQNNVTIRGFEITNRRSVATGDNLIWEYNYIHDTTEIGPGLCFAYTSSPDGPAAQIIMRPSTNAIFRHFKIKNTFGEAFYLGSINPDAPASFQAAHGNQHSHVLIEDFVIEGAGTGGGQGDAIDCKHGITYLTIRRGDINSFGRNGVGIGLPMSATDIDEHNLIERNYIHDPRHDDEYGGQYGIYAGTGGALSMSLWGFNGCIIRNNIIANCRRGIQYSSDGSQPVVNGFVYNNTVYGTYSDAGLAVNCTSNCEVKNNFVFGGAGDPQASISGCVTDYNAHDTGYKPWISNSEGAHTLAISAADALASVVDGPNGNFHLTGKFIAGKGATLTGFSDDYDGMTRTTPWDIGAYAYSGTAPSPGPSASATTTPTATRTPTATATPSQTSSPSPTSTPNPTISPTPQPTNTPQPPTSPTPATAPDPPDALTARVVKGKDVELTWRDNSNNEVSFEIQRSEDNGNCANWPTTASVGANTVTYTDTTTEKKKTYCFRVRARGVNGLNSPWSNVATVRP